MVMLPVENLLVAQYSQNVFPQIANWKGVIRSKQEGIDAQPYSSIFR